MAAWTSGDAVTGNQQTYGPMCRSSVTSLLDDHGQSQRQDFIPEIATEVPGHG